MSREDYLSDKEYIDDLNDGSKKFDNLLYKSKGEKIIDIINRYIELSLLVKTKERTYEESINELDTLYNIIKQSTLNIVIMEETK